jgi:hypothetical protein
MPFPPPQPSFFARCGNLPLECGGSPLLLQSQPDYQSDIFLERDSVADPQPRAVRAQPSELLSR